MIASPVEQPLEALALRLGNSLASGGIGFVHLLVDQSAFPNIRSLWPHLSGGVWEPILGDVDRQPDGGSPLLLDVSPICASPKLRNAIRKIYDQGRFANCLCLLRSRLDCTQLAKALRERTNAELPDQLAVMLRFFDTRTLALLPRMFTPDQYGRFMSCADDWHYVDRNGHTQSMPAAVDPTGAPFVSPLVLNETQERMLVDDGLVDAVIDQLLDHRHPALRDLAPPQQFERVQGLIGAARRHGIDEVLDALSFCFAAFESGDDFDLREPWSTRLGAHRRGEMSLEAALHHV